MYKNTAGFYFGRVSITLITLVFLYALSTNVSYSQVNYYNNDAWRHVHPKPQGYVLRWCRMWDANTWYMTGYYGTFMKTTDGGSSWNINTHAGVFNGSHIYDAYFFNQSNGIFACDKGLMRTNDGGLNFSLITGTSTPLGWHSLYFLDNNTGYTAGGFGGAGMRLAKTTDGGNSWIASTTLTTGGYNDIYTPDGILIILAGADGNVNRSTDAGASWNTINTGCAGPLNSLKFVNPDTGFAAGNAGYFGFTTDGGVSWLLRNSGIAVGNYYDIDFKIIGTTVNIYLTGNDIYI